MTYCTPPETNTNDVLVELAIAATKNADAIAKIADALVAREDQATAVSIKIANLPPFE